MINSISNNTKITAIKKEALNITLFFIISNPDSNDNNWLSLIIISSLKIYWIIKKMTIKNNIRNTSSIKIYKNLRKLKLTYFLG